MRFWRRTTVILMALRRVYAVEPDLVLYVARVENRKRVAVRNCHDLAGDGLRLSRGGQAQENGEQRGFDGLYISPGHVVLAFG